MKSRKWRSADAEKYILLILSRSHDNQPAQNWLKGLRDAIDSLESLPARCPLIPEQMEIAVELRHLLYESHRLIFEIAPEKVRILRIYHGEQKPLTPAGLRRFVRPTKHA